MNLQYADGNILKVVDMCIEPGDSAFLLDDGKTAILYDTGFGFTGFRMAEKIKSYLGERTLDYIFLTHSHYDHALGSAYILRTFPNAKVVASQYAAYVFTRPGAKAVMKDLDARHAARCGVSDYPFLGDELRVDIAVEDGDVVQAGDLRFEILSLPGHTKCCIGFYLAEQKLFLSCESLCVYVGNEQLRPAVLVGFDLCLQSIEKVSKLDIEAVVAPHYGLLTAQESRFYLENGAKAVLDMQSFILRQIQAGLTNEEIAGNIAKTRSEFAQSLYPKDAAALNTNIMINLLRK